MNEAKKTLTMEFIESIMDENYTSYGWTIGKVLMRTETYYRNALKNKVARIFGQRSRNGMRMPKSRQHRR